MRIDVMEEMFVARAEIAQAISPGCGFCEAVLGTLAITGEAHIALAAIGGKTSFLCVAEAHLLR